MKMFRIFAAYSFFAMFTILPMHSAKAYEEVAYDEVMIQLKAENIKLYKKAEKVYRYATNNSREIIEKPLLTKHNKALNGVLDRNNRVSAKFYERGSDGTEARMIMLFKFGGKKYKVVQDYIRAEKCKKWSSCAPWEKVE
jgi:hypothetical protein